MAFTDVGLNPNPSYDTRDVSHKAVKIPFTARNHPATTGKILATTTSPTHIIPQADLPTLRTQIDALDAEILLQLNKRAGFARQVGTLKASIGEPMAYRPER